MNCNCHPDSPFHWMHNPRPSIFIREVGFRTKGVVVTDTHSYLAADLQEEVKTKTTKEKELIAYKQFGIYMRANPNIKPTKNKHEL